MVLDVMILAKEAVIIGGNEAVVIGGNGVVVLDVKEGGSEVVVLDGIYGKRKWGCCYGRKKQGCGILTQLAIHRAGILTL